MKRHNTVDPETKDFVYIVQDDDYGTTMVFRSKLHAVQYMVKKVKEWNFNFLDDENLLELPKKTEKELNEIFFDFFTFHEAFIID